MPKVRLGANRTGFTRDPAGFGWRGLLQIAFESNCAMSAVFANLFVLPQFLRVLG